jgi:release factor glutamine methyltransferase
MKKEWTVAKLLKRASQILKERGSDTPRLDAELLLVKALGFKDRVELYRNAHMPLTEEEVERYRQLVVRRAKGEPVAYITGKKEFYGFEFFVEKGVLVPRPETELLVEVTVGRLKDEEGLEIVDVGTGSGCIVITLCKLLGCKNSYYGIDVSSKALEVARKNAESLKCSCVTFLKGSLLSPIEGTVDAVIANLPYVPLGDKRLHPWVLKHEPAVALFGGKDGLELVSQLVLQAKEKLKSGGFLALEVGEGQAKRVASLLEVAGFTSVELHRDLSGVERVVTAEKGGS